MFSETELKEILKLPKEVQKKLLSLTVNPALNKYIASKIQTDFWDSELIECPSSLRVGGVIVNEDEETKGKQAKEASNNKEFEYALKYLLEQKKIADIQKDLYDSLLTTDKQKVDKATQKKLANNEFQIAIKTTK